LSFLERKALVVVGAVKVWETGGWERKGLVIPRLFVLVLRSRSRNRPVEAYSSNTIRDGATA